MRNLLPAVQMFTLRSFTQTPEDLETTFRRIREEIGCDTVQTSMIGRSIKPEFLADVSREYGIKICVTHSPVDQVFSGDREIYRQLIRNQTLRLRYHRRRQCHSPLYR